MKKAFVFPGQGAQKVGMVKDLYESYAVVRELFEEADDALGFSLTKLCFEGPDEELMKTYNTQPAILTASTACCRVLEQEGVTPDIAAGHSLGEYSALVAAGALSFADAVRAVSIGPNPQDGGDLGFMELSDMAPGMMEQVSRMKKGDVSPLLAMNANKVQIALLDFEEAENADHSNAVPDSETAGRIEQILRRPRLQERFEEYTAQLRDKALIDIRN